LHQRKRSLRHWILATFLFVWRAHLGALPGR
jgi:hypothetical protein